jgi:hypothetical protein
MTHSPRLAPVSLSRLAVAAVLLLPAASGLRAADSALGPPLCAVLKKVFPEVKTFKPEGARAQLVMAVAEKFDYDAVKLRQVRAEIDQATTASCARDREAMLGVLKMKSHAEAVS